ncbi:MAG: hypothetical protein QOJ29_3826 [Thermoleophilaceae bacterium]|jgi:hypothetical protein|nr:hypothetical protein [Thermoleophilaceae bacterium]
MGSRAGKLRPSQAVTQNGPGALVDLPTLSMVMLTADLWEIGQARRVDEPRLARRLNVKVFRSPPFYNSTADSGGIPARIFPEYLVCPRCRRLAPHERFEFDEAHSEHLCNAPTCPGGGRAVAYPARFMVACSRGHLDDFPWHQYVHPGVACDAELRLEDSGSTGSITDLWVKCPKHKASENLGKAFGRAGRKRLPTCSGARPLFGDIDPEGCAEAPRVLLRGASNAYFPAVTSALSIPPWSDPLQLALGQHEENMAKVDSPGKLAQWLDIIPAPELRPYTPDQIWQALVRRRKGEAAPAAIDLRVEEWRAFQSEPGKIDSKAEFKSVAVDVPEGFGEFIARVVVLERLREVRALHGFTRIDAIPDVGSLEDVEAFESALSPIFKAKATWYPGVELRGEGLFIQLDESAVQAWEQRFPVQKLQSVHEQAQQRWYARRGLELTRPKTARFLLLHSLAHLVIRQLGLDCGYASASLRERIYSSSDAGAEMAGVLIYTATPDSEGSLGGLVEMGRPEDLGPLVRRALEDAELCAGDPHCAGRGPDAPNNDLNGAACHSCILISETSCEAANRYLDRGTVTPSLRGDDAAFFIGA